MTDNQINYIGFAVLAALFWYVQIYRPRKKMKNPGELLLKPVMDRDDRDMYEAIRATFPAPYILKSNVTLDDLLYSPDMNKKAHFHKAMRQEHVTWLVLDEQLTPLLAVGYAESADDMKLRYLSQAGIGCCIFTRGATINQMQDALQEAATSLQEMHAEVAQNNDSPLTA